MHFLSKTSTLQKPTCPVKLPVSHSHLGDLQAGGTVGGMAIRRCASPTVSCGRQWHWDLLGHPGRKSGTLAPEPRRDVYRTLRKRVLREHFLSERAEEGRPQGFPHPEGDGRLTGHKTLLLRHHKPLSDPSPLYNPPSPPLLGCVKARMRLIHREVFLQESTSGKKGRTNPSGLCDGTRPP